MTRTSRHRKRESRDREAGRRKGSEVEALTRKARSREVRNPEVVPESQDPQPVKDQPADRIGDGRESLEAGVAERNVPDLRLHEVAQELRAKNLKWRTKIKKKAENIQSLIAKGPDRVLEACQAKAGLSMDIIHNRPEVIWTKTK